MKLEPSSKVEKRNTMASKKYDDDVISESYDVIVNFLI